MKAIIVNGSPRKNWNTDQALQKAAYRDAHFAEDLEKAYQMGLSLAEKAIEVSDGQEK